jgi:hypothetical protein
MQVLITKDDSGHIVGFGEKGERAYARFKKRLEHLWPGELLSFAWNEPRSPGFHKMFFVMLNELFKQQEQFIDEDQMRAWLTVGAGYADFMPGPKGRMMALPKSIKWEKMEDNEFRELVRAVWQFLRTDHAQQFLWPMASIQSRQGFVETLLEGWNG